MRATQSAIGPPSVSLSSCMYDACVEATCFGTVRTGPSRPYIMHRGTWSDSSLRACSRCSGEHVHSYLTVRFLVSFYISILPDIPLARCLSLLEHESKQSVPYICICAMQMGPRGASLHFGRAAM